MLGILTFGGLYFYGGGGIDGLVTAFLGFIPALVIVLILFFGVVRFANEVVKPFWRWLVK